MLAPILLLTSVAFANDQIASCEIKKSTIVSLSPAGIAQVSNLRLIEVVAVFLRDRSQANRVSFETA